MHPNGGHHYFYQDTWRDLQSAIVKGNNIIGSALNMPA